DQFRLFRNVVAGGHSLRVVLHGTVSAPAPYGAEVTVTAGGRTEWRTLVSGGTPHSQSTPTLTFELGAAARADQVQVRWPSGLVQTLTNVDANHVLAIEEPRFLELPARSLAVGAELVAFVQRAQPNDDPTGVDLKASDGVPFTLDSLGGG